MYPMRMLIPGAIMALVGIAVLVFGSVKIGEEEDSIKKAAVFDGSAAGTVKQGDLVMVVGEVSAKNKILVHDFVDAEKQNNDAGSWSIMEKYRQPVLADLARGEILLSSEYLCRDAIGNNAFETGQKTANNDPIRYQGLRRGDPITAVGTLTSTAPAALAVKYWYSGSAAEYRNFLSSSRMSGRIGSVIVILLGAGLFLWGLKSRQGAG